MLTNRFTVFLEWIMWTVIFLSLVILFFALSVPYYSGDVKNHLVWAQSILNDGPFGFYERTFHNFAFPNYPPVAMWLFVVGLKLYQIINQITWYLNVSLGIFPSSLIYYLQSENVLISFLKLPAIISNLITAIFMFLTIKAINPKISLWKSMLSTILFLFNPAIFYLSVVWGQIDILPIMFFLIALYLLIKKLPLWSAIFVTLSLLSKQTVIIFLPIYLFFIFKQYGFRILSLVTTIILILFYIAYLPFHSPSLIWPLQLFKTNFDMVAHSVNENAINLWGFLFSFNRVSDEQFFLIFTFQQWGYILFILLIFIPLVKLFKEKINFSELFLMLLIVVLVYFFSLTRIHERYLAPALVFSPLLTLMNKRYWVGYFFFTFLYLLNLYRGLFQPDISLFNFLVNSILFLKILVIGYLIMIVYYIYHFSKKSHG